MKALRFRECVLDGNLRLVLETHIALTQWQRLKARNYALMDYRKRLIGSRGWKKRGYLRIIAELENDSFLERPIPRYDFEQESLVFGGQ
jgi:hypothetical protein